MICVLIFLACIAINQLHERVGLLSSLADFLLSLSPFLLPLLLSRLIRPVSFCQKSVVESEVLGTALKKPKFIQEVEVTPLTDDTPGDSPTDALSEKEDQLFQTIKSSPIHKASSADDKYASELKTSAAELELEMVNCHRNFNVSLTIRTLSIYTLVCSFGCVPAIHWVCINHLRDTATVQGLICL
ncbi:unnamed protein product [Protopolystoma xenopodis]|uniref:Uncharacterized protein n=1 Tax=Protopolystoma xenopodis TaxID=117903 RepID=A0A3S5AG65_9PLAT|nr:unnamed protein product [Protopolystoma xenopodis]